MNGNTSSSVHGETTDDESRDDNPPTYSPAESVNGALRREENDEEDDGEEEENGDGDGDGDDELDEDEEVDIMTVDQEITDAAMEIEEEKDVSMEETTQSESSFSAAASAAAFAAVDQDSSESDGEESETESQISHNFPPNFPLEFTKRLVDPLSIRPRILMEKKLRESDVDENRNRLSIPAKKVKEAFLLLDEEDRMSAGEDMEVEVIEPDSGTVSAVTLRRRRIGENQPPSYVLTGQWSQVVARNSDALKRGRRVRVWYFHDGDGDVGLRLCFAIEVFESGKGGDGEFVKELTQKWWGQNIFTP
ncbi:VID27-like protein [Momordica charantia]|uniref:VID27-like protein n=1 Tax=Momordica charantia TaxID=3673 RepID=A0A6J1DRC9_MOMCH|nr:VID27-like protein [Momordica charantia]